MTTIASPRTAPRQRGFSLIEVLIGLLIAMVAVVIMMEVLITSEQRTRTTAGGNEAMSTGAVMLHLMQRDLVQSGYGINTAKLLGCNMTLPAPSAKTVPLAPVVIYKSGDTSTVVPAGDADTDRLLVFYGNDNGQPEGNTVFTVTGSTYTVQAPTAFSIGDYVVAYPDSCTANLKLAKVTAVSAVDVTVDAVQAGATILYNMGKTPKVIAYAVRNGALSSCDYMAADCSSASAANWTALGGNIVSLRAQYGKDTTGPAMDGSVDAWDQTTPTNSCEWVRASTVRYAIVARSAQYESALDASGQRTCEAVTAAAPGWNGSAGAAINLGAATDWQCYRYRTFENVAPSRNIVWMGAQAGC
jgi:type IV pilus assembly protein PilW